MKRKIMNPPNDLPIDPEVISPPRLRLSSQISQKELSRALGRSIENHEWKAVLHHWGTIEKAAKAAGITFCVLLIEETQR